jgi:enoyl-[acyl-carrier-protein] reductase (NADH)
MIDASEIGYLAVFLCSDKSWAINGEVIAADGGGSSSVYY